MNPDIEQSYAACRSIARREARNFYYAFVALPKPKRNAICAVYAFMRHADDISDDETRTQAERRQALSEWMAAWRGAQQGAATDDPVFVALADAQRRFKIPAKLLDQLVEGTAMDLEAGVEPFAADPEAARLDTYATFDDLYRYCYLVASVVGLVCIRIFGYSDPRAERLAEETGIAFQLTNILRDVREDALRGRVYLPLEDLARFGVSPESLKSITRGGEMSAGLNELLRFEAARAEEYYQSARSLLPLISPDSRPALRVLVAIYSRLLRHIERRRFDVFSAKIRVPASEKMWILAQGLAQVFAYRAAGRA